MFSVFMRVFIDLGALPQHKRLLVLGGVAELGRIGRFPG